MPNNTKYAFLTVERGGLYGAREISPEEWLEREMRAWIAKGKRRDGRKYASRRIANIAKDRRYGPHRITSKVIRDGLDGGAPTEWALACGAILMEYAARRARANGRQVEHQPPTSPSGGAMPRPMLVTGEMDKAA